MKWILIFFAMADVCCIIMLNNIFSLQFSSLTSTTETLNGLMFFSRSLFVLTYASLFCSAIFLLAKPKIGILIYFIQIPSRIIFSIFSFGFISYINFEGLPFWFNKFLIALIVFLEFLRIYFSYSYYKKFSK